MSVGIFTIEQKIEALNMEIAEIKGARREPGSPLHQQYRILQAIAADMRARQELPRNDVLTSLGRALEVMKSDREPGGHYDRERAMAVANVVVGTWPIISQALENFAKEHAE